ncbi:MAG: GNAT family N-acetyltransferase [Candidatus Limnocylindria bacterium]
MTILKATPIISGMQVEVRPFQGSAKEWFEAIDVSFGQRPQDEDIAAFAGETELDRAIAAYVGDRVVGTAGIFSFNLTVPGASLAAAGVTMVGVHPTHRRRGILTAMMRAQLEAIHERGEALAILWASEGTIYGRFGYGLATFKASFDMERSAAAFREQHVPRGSLRLVEPEDAIEAIAPIYDRYLPMRAGTFTRSPAFWRAEFLYDPERWRHGGGPAFYLLRETDGVGDGYARYRLHSDWDDRGPKGGVQVTETMALTPEAERELWSYLLSVDLTTRTRASNLPVDTPLRFMLAEPRRMGLTVTDAAWLRIVDLPAALGQRTYAGRDRLVLEVHDGFLPWNDGRWEVEAMQEGARVARTETDPDLVLTAADLGAVYLGGVRMAELALAGRIEECTPGAVNRADALLATPLAPWCPGVF